MNEFAVFGTVIQIAEVTETYCIVIVKGQSFVITSDDEVFYHMDYMNGDLCFPLNSPLWPEVIDELKERNIVVW
jgi:hypothetical protein